MTSASDEKWRPFNCFLSQVGLRTYQHPYITSSLACLAVPYFSTLFINGMIIGNMLLNVFCDFLYRFVWNISHSKKNSARYCHTSLHVFVYITRHTCQILMKVEISEQIFEKIFKYQISWKVIQCDPSYFMRTDGQTDVLKLIVAFHNMYKALKRY